MASVPLEFFMVSNSLHPRHSNYISARSPKCVTFPSDKVEGFEKFIFFIQQYYNSCTATALIRSNAKESQFKYFYLRIKI